jgi:hypothetical protein
VRTLRTSLNLLGDGFVEAVANGTLEAIRKDQKLLTGGQISGLTPRVPVLEANIDTNRSRMRAAFLSLACEFRLA